MKKSILALLLAVVLIATAILVVSPKAEAATPAHADGKAAHCECAGVKKGDHTKCDASVKWKAVGTWAELKDAINDTASGKTGYFYLTANIKTEGLGTVVTNVGSKVVICFNGYTLTKDNGERLFSNLGELTFTNCKSKGGITANPDMNRVMVLSYGGSKLNLFAGTIEINGEGGGFYMSATASDTVAGKDGVKPSEKPNELNIYGGTFKRTVGSTSTQECLQMITLYGSAASTFNMYGGTIDGTKVVNNNPLVYGRSANCVINIKDGTIKNGYATVTPANNAGNLYCAGTFTMSGGTIKDGKAGNWGGNIFVQGTATISGGTITGGEAASGGNIYTTKDLTISGGTISNGLATATTGANGGGSIAAKGTLTISGGTIKDGSAPGLHGGNIYAFNGATLNITGGDFIGGFAGASGGNLFNQANAMISGGTFVGGRAGTSAGNIYNVSPGTMVMTGATLKNGVSVRGGNFYSTIPNTIVKNCTFIGGIATNGGNISTSQDLTLENCTIKDGSASLGGGIHPSNGSKLVNLFLVGDIKFSGNMHGDVGVNTRIVEGAITQGSAVYVGNMTSTDKVSIYSKYPVEFTDVASDKFVASVDYHEIKTVGDKMVLQGKGGNVVTVNGTGYATMDAAEAALTDDAKVVLQIGTVGQTLDLNKNVYLDTNSCVIDGVTIAAGKTVYGMDSTTNKYDEFAASKIAITGEGTVAPVTVTSGTVRKYMAIKDAAGLYSFHRFYVGVTNTTLMPAQKAVGAVAKFAGTPSVAALLKTATAYGVEFNTGADFNGNSLGATAGKKDFAAGTVNTVRTLMKAEGYGLLTQAAAEKSFYARAYIELADGSKLYSAIATVCAKDMMEAIDANWAKLTDAQKTAVQDMINGLQWDLPAKFELKKITKK